MKPKTFAIILFFAVTVLISGPAQAHYLWMEPNGLETAIPGDQVSISVYFHAEVDDTIYGWGLNMGFDDTAYDGQELTYQSFEYGPDQSVLATDEAVGYLPNGSTEYPGEGVVHAGKYDWGFVGYDIDAGDDSLLFTVSFLFDGGIWDGSDAWIEWNHEYPNESYFDLETGYIGYGTFLELEGGGPDYAAVPIPGAAILLGSGLLALIGIRRRVS